MASEKYVVLFETFKELRKNRFLRTLALHYIRVSPSVERLLHVCNFHHAIVILIQYNKNSLN